MSDETEFLRMAHRNESDGLDYWRNKAEALEAENVALRVVEVAAREVDRLGPGHGSWQIEAAANLHAALAVLDATRAAT